MRKSFLESTARTTEWANCLSALDNFLARHSKSIKFYKLNNIKGVHKIIMELYNNLDKFVEEQEDIEITIPVDKQGGIE